MKQIRTAIVGCGAVADAHLMILAEQARLVPTVLVDKNLTRAQELASRYSVGAAVGDFKEAIGQVDAAIVALPHHLHAPIAIELLRAGVHVFVEKPMAVTVAECDAMIQAARESQRVLAVGLARRFYHSARFVKQAVARGMLGRIRRFDVREGFVYNWPVASDFMFKKEAGGGVLADTGAHTLDTLLWWLGPFESVDYYDDSEGGVEANCELHLRLESGAEGIVELSRTRDLRGSLIIEGEHASLEVQTKFDAEMSFKVAGQEATLAGQPRVDGKPEDALDCFRAELDDFGQAVGEGRAPFVPGEEAKLAIELIEACHANRKRLEHPWSMPPGARAGG